MNPDQLVHDVAVTLVWIGALGIVVSIGGTALRFWLAERRAR